jgi:hypothetical protein
MLGVLTLDFGYIGSTNREAASRYQERDTGKDAGGSPAPIPWARINCRATPRIAGNRRAKMAPPTKQVTPPMATVQGAPILAATAPPISAPMGPMPMNIIE